MIYNPALLMAVQERTAELQRSARQSKTQANYPDKERQPRLLKHWANR